MSRQPIPLSRFRRPQTNLLPANSFGELTGVFDHWSPKSELGKVNPNHVFLWIKTTDGAYEAAVNVMSERASGTAAELQYSIANEPSQVVPPQGFAAAQLSYRDLGLTQADFTMVETGVLRDYIISNASTCQMMGVFGHTYSDGTGIHDVHLQAPQQDGALVFRFDADHGGPEARWVFLKFQNQTL